MDCRIALKGFRGLVIFCLLAFGGTLFASVPEDDGPGSLPLTYFDETLPKKVLEEFREGLEQMAVFSPRVAMDLNTALLELKDHPVKQLRMLKKVRQLYAHPLQFKSLMIRYEIWQKEFFRPARKKKKMFAALVPAIFHDHRLKRRQEKRLKRYGDVMWSGGRVRSRTPFQKRKWK